jgi:Putative adhesin
MTRRQRAEVGQRTARGTWVRRGGVVAMAVGGAILGTSGTAWAMASGLTRANAPGAGRDTTADFHWSGHVDGDRWVRIRNLSGSIRFERSSGNDVTITGHKSWQHGDADEVRFVMQRTGAGDGDVLVCALWGEDSHCDVDSYDSHFHHHGWHDDDNDVQVEFTVMVPAGIKVLASTVNGDVAVSGVTRDVDASTVNGRVDAASDGGPVEAKSVNGSVDAEMHRIGDAGRLDYSSVNGSVHVTLPADVKADIELSTVNGSVRSDFPISVSGSLEPRHLRGTIGGGGVPVRIDTVNGSIELRKGDNGSGTG